MIINNKQYQTVWMEGNIIHTIDQRLLPHEFKIVQLETINEVATSIKDMWIRGAPAIGGMAAFGIAMSALNTKSTNLNEFYEQLDKDAEFLKSTRPTAYDLFHAVDTILKQIKSQSTTDQAKSIALLASNEYVGKSIESCKKIGEFGNEIIKPNDSILTHCNAGALATIDYGTALAPMRIAHYNKKPIHVFVDETRPRCQGARLTAWELAQENIPHSVIADNASGYFMKKGEINIVMTGADRIAANGDAANKIGTYEKAVLAKENNIPFYIAAPFTTIDPNTPSGDDINIEERHDDEVSHMFGWHDNELKNVRITPKESKVRNPAFDVTPAKYITGIITERGILNPREIRDLL